MKREREQLIRELAAELRPSTGLAPPRRAALAWLAAGSVFVALVTLATGPLRPGLAQQLRSEPGLWIDLLLGGLTAFAAALGWVRLRTPGLTRGARSAAPALLLFAAWAAWQGVELGAGAGAPSLLGQRGACAPEILLFSALPLAAALWMAGRAAPLERGWTGLLAGLAAGVLPAFAMQLACIDAPLHTLLLHLGPVVVVVAAGALLGRRVLQRV